MQKMILTILGVVIILIAGLLFVQEKFGININPFTNQNITQVSEGTLTIDSLGNYRKPPITYKKGESIAISGVISNKGGVSATDKYSFKAYKVTGLWDTLKRDFNYTNKESNAVTDNGIEVVDESDLLQMVKEADCTPVNGNCYDNVNTNDGNNKFGGVEITFDEPSFEVDFDVAVAENASHTQSIEFTPVDCGYYMLVLGNEKYWASGDAGDSKVGFIVLNSCNEGQITSGVSDYRPAAVVTPEINVPAVATELPKAGSEAYILSLFVIGLALSIKKYI